MSLGGNFLRMMGTPRVVGILQGASAPWVGGAHCRVVVPRMHGALQEVSAHQVDFALHELGALG